MKMIHFAAFLLLYGCGQTAPKIKPLDCDNAVVYEKFDMQTIEDRIRAKDSCYISYVIQSLQDTSLTDCEFTDRAGSLTEILDFMFCGFECTDSPNDGIFWTTRPKADRMRTRAIMAKAWFEYSKSCLFMSDSGTRECDKSIDLMPFCKAQLLHDSLFLDKFRKTLMEICVDCK